MVVDREFGFKIKPEELVGVETLGSFYDFIENRLNGK